MSIEGATYQFALTGCEVAVDYFGVDGSDGEYTLTIRHASPPSRQPSEPSLSIFVIEGAERLEAPPAAMVFEMYDPETGRARGSTVVTLEVPGPEIPTTFDVHCDATG